MSNVLPKAQRLALPQVVRDVTIVELFLVFGAIALLGNVIASSINVYSARKSRQQDVVPALLGLAPFFLSAALIYLWLSARPDIVYYHLVPFIFFVGATFAYMVGLIIVAHVSNNVNFPSWNILQIPILLGCIDAYLPYFGM